MGPPTSYGAVRRLLAQKVDERRNRSRLCLRRGVSRVYRSLFSLWTSALEISGPPMPVPKLQDLVAEEDQGDREALRQASECERERGLSVRSKDLILTVDAYQSHAKMIRNRDVV